MKTKCNKCGCDLEISSVTCGGCNGTLPPNPVAGCEVKSWIRNIDQLPDTLIFRGFQIDIYADMKDGRNELTKYLKALLERGNDA